MMIPILALAALGVYEYEKNRAPSAWEPTKLGKDTDPPLPHGAGVTFVLINATTGDRRQLFGQVTDTVTPPNGVYTVLVAADHNDPPAYGYEPGRMVEFGRAYLGPA